MSVSASRKPNPGYYQKHLRVLFVWYLVRNEKFDAIVLRLRPMWMRASAGFNDHSRLKDAPFHSLPRGVRALQEYQQSVATAVADELRCLDHGQPATWICQAVHGAVTDGPVVLETWFNHGLRDDIRVAWGDIRIPVFTTGSAGVGMLLNGKSFGDIIEIDPPDNPGEGHEGFISPQLSAFDNWDELSRVAHQQLDLLLGELRTRIEDETGAWRRVYRKGHKTRIEQTMPNLLAWLVDRESLWASDRPASHALLKELGLDQPGPVKKSSRIG